MSNATEIRKARSNNRSLEEVAAALRAEWRMIASVSLRPCRDGRGFDARLRLDPVVVEGAFEQQGYPLTPATMALAEERRLNAIAGCVERVNARLPDSETIRSFRVIG